MGLQQKRLITNSAYTYNTYDNNSPLSEINILYVINDCLNEFNFYNSHFPKMGKAKAIIKAQIMLDKSMYRWGGLIKEQSLLLKRKLNENKEQPM